MNNKAIAAILVGCSLLTTACGTPAMTSQTQIDATVSQSQSTITPITSAGGYTSPNMPANATYPAIAAWTMYPLRLDQNPAVAGQPVTIWTSVYMVDFLITFIIARLEVNGTLVDQARWMLYIDEADPHFFVYTPPAPGTYNITIVANLEENEAYNQKGGEQISISQTTMLVVN